MPARSNLLAQSKVLHIVLLSPDVCKKNLPVVVILISSLLALGYASLLLYYRMGWKHIPLFVPAFREQKLPAVSVIIAARNEEQTIKHCLAALAHQSFPPGQFEVILVDDHSTDNTLGAASEFATQIGQFRIVKLDEIVTEKLNSYKKKAIETGISLASGELIVTTDADCIAPRDWIATIAMFYQQNRSAMIAAPVKMQVPAERNWIQRLFFIFQALDFTMLQGITGAALSRNFHHMANGANLAYPRAVFMRVNGFQGIDDLASGDDMLLMEKMRAVQPEGIHYLKSRTATVSTFPEKTVAGFINQRIRWASKAAAYKESQIKWVMALVYMVNLWWLLLLILSFFALPAWAFIAFFLWKGIFELLLLSPVTGFFQNRKLLIWLIPLQPVHIFYTVVAGWMGNFGTYRWKGRKVR